MEEKIKKILAILNELPDDELNLLTKAVGYLCKMRIANTDGCGKMNADADEGWFTTENGKHYHVGEGGEVDKGPNFLKGKPIDHSKAKKSSGSGGSTGESSDAPKETVGSYTSGGNGGKSTGSLKPGSKSKGGHKVIDTADAIGEKDKEGNLKDNSLRKYVDADGNLSEERQAEHDRILDDCFKGKTPEKEGKRKMTMLGGGPASGKSSAVRAGLFEVGAPENSITINPDDLKAALPGYKEMARQGSGAAGFYHEESSALAKSEYAETLEGGYNALYDGTGDGSPNSVRKKIKQARDAGYAVEGRYVTVDTEEAVRRNQKRYEDAKKKYDETGEGEPPRLPDPDLVRATHQNVTDCAVECAKDYDTFALYDNNGDHNVHQIATGGNGQGIKAVPGYEQELQNFLNKGKGKYKVRSDGTVEVIESPFKK